MFKKGDLVQLELNGRTLKGRIYLASENQESLVVLVDEGIPVPFTIAFGSQCLMLKLEPDGVYSDLFLPSRIVRIKEATGSSDTPSGRIPL